jgi:hypothetical protein
MSSATTATRELVKFDLEDSECSTAKVEVRLDADNVWVSNSVEFFVSGDNEAQTIYVDARSHSYTSVDNHESISNSSTIFNHRFTRAEAEALVATLANELGKL